MEREEDGRGDAEPPPPPQRGRDKILCYINMQSPGRTDPEPLERAHTDAINATLSAGSCFWCVCDLMLGTLPTDSN